MRLKKILGSMNLLHRAEVLTGIQHQKLFHKRINMVLNTKLHSYVVRLEKIKDMLQAENNS